MIRLKHILREQTETPSISGITILQNKLTPGMGGVLVNGVLRVLGCDSPTGTLTVGSHRYDAKLVAQAIGTDTVIRVYGMNSGDTTMTKLAEYSQPANSLVFRFEFPREKMPNISDDTQFFVAVFKAGQPLKYNGQRVMVQPEGFML